MTLNCRKATTWSSHYSLLVLLIELESRNRMFCESSLTITYRVVSPPFQFTTKDESSVVSQDVPRNINSDSVRKEKSINFATDGPPSLARQSSSTWRRNVAVKRKVVPFTETVSFLSPSQTFSLSLCHPSVSRELELIFLFSPDFTVCARQRCRKGGERGKKSPHLPCSSLLLCLWKIFFHRCLSTKTKP